MHRTVLRHILSGGDDYELVFTAPAHQREAVLQAGAGSNTPVTRIGRITAATGVQVLAPDGTPVRGDWTSFDHFKA